MDEMEIEGMEKKAKVPKLRFPGFTGEWEERKLGEVAEFSKGNGYSKDDLVDFGTPIILYGRMYTKYQIQINDVDTFVNETKNSVYSTGLEVIVPASGETAEDIAIASAVMKPGIILGGDINIIYPISRLNSVFLALQISGGKAKREMSKRAQGKSIVHLHNADLREVAISIPEVVEQEKISRFFYSIDKLIMLQQCKLAHLQAKKKCLLQKMFPKKGERFPELRFPGFTDVWKVYKLGTVCKDYIRKTVIQNQYPVLTSSQQKGILLQTDYFANRQTTTNDNVGYYVLPRGYFTFRSRSDNDVFTFNRNDVIEKGIISYFYPVFYANGVDSDFLLRRLNYGLKKQIVIYSEGTGQHVLSLSKFKQIVTLFPSIEEQKQIGTFFESIDDLITLHERKLAHLQTQKKALLQQMFV